MGLVTDRDIVVGVLAAGLDPSVFTIGDIVSRDVITVKEDDDIFDAVRKMRTKGVRRLPVVDSDGALRGIFTLDDFVELVSEELRDVADIIDREQAHESRTRLALGAKGT
jgi:CBS domain-containing protein